MLMRTLCRKTIKKGTPNSPMNGGQGVEVSKTLFYKNIDMTILIKKEDFLCLQQRSSVTISMKIKHIKLIVHIFAYEIMQTRRA